MHPLSKAEQFNFHYSQTEFYLFYSLLHYVIVKYYQSSLMISLTMKLNLHTKFKVWKDYVKHIKIKIKEWCFSEVFSISIYDIQCMT